MAGNDNAGKLKRAGRAIGRYGVRRVRSPELAEGNRRAIKDGWRAALAALRPISADRDDLRGGFEGRHTDGGRARFGELVRERQLNDAMLGRIETGHRVTSIAFGVAAVVAFIGGLVSVARADTTIMLVSGLAVALFSTVLAAMAIRADYSRWQIASRRFGGFREYLARRA